MSYTEIKDSTAILRASDDGQSELRRDGESLIAAWCCSSCLLPTGGRDRLCRHHPTAPPFLRHIHDRREA